MNFPSIHMYIVQTDLQIYCQFKRINNFDIPTSATFSTIEQLERNFCTMYTIMYIHRCVNEQKTYYIRIHLNQQKPILSLVTDIFNSEPSPPPPSRNIIIIILHFLRFLILMVTQPLTIIGQRQCFVMLYRFSDSAVTYFCEILW